MIPSILEAESHAERVLKAKAYNDVAPTSSGPMAFEWWLASIEGAGFLLLPEKHHTQVNIAEAKGYIHSSRDVVGRIKSIRAGEEAE